MEEVFAYFLTYRFLVYLLVVAFFLGIQLLEKLPQVLYYPFLSLMNLVSGVFLFLEIQFLGNADENDTSSLLFGFFSILLLSMNLVGGHLLIKKQIRFFKNLK